MFKLSPREPWSFLDAIPCHWPDNWPRVTGPTTGHGRREAVAGEKHPMQGIWHSAHPDVTLAESGVPRTPFFWDVSKAGAHQKRNLMTRTQMLVILQSHASLLVHYNVRRAGDLGSWNLHFKQGMQCPIQHVKQPL